MDETVKKEWELTKLKAEVQKIENEISILKSNKIRAWITVISVSVGILVSVFSIYKTLAEINSKNRQLKIESQIRTHQLFLDNVLEKMSGIKTSFRELNSQGKLKVVKSEHYGGTAQFGSYVSAYALACEFPNLKYITLETFKFQVEQTPRDRWAVKIIKLLEENNCSEFSLRSQN